MPGGNNPEAGYLLENVNSSADTRDNVVMDSQTIRYVLGTEVVTDAARHNSCAHRPRAFWTNMVNPNQLQKTVELTHRTTTKVWKDCLEPSYMPNTALQQKNQAVLQGQHHRGYGQSSTRVSELPGVQRVQEQRTWHGPSH